MKILDGITSPGDAAAADSIAIIGMAGRFPGARNVAEFWRNIQAGRDTISHFRDDELEDAFSAETRASGEYVKARPILDGVDLFDAEFFGMYPREAALTDPQQRVFLECAWEALEDGGVDPATYPGAIGVFAGCSMNTYFLSNVCADRATIEDFTSNFQVGNYPMLVGAGLDFLATRISYKLDLRGPACTVGSACSTSLLAIAQACQSLQLFQADMMLAGGVSISFPQRRGYLHQEGGMVSPDGRCRPFDARAGGTVFGSGAAIVLLKRLEDALRDGDRIYALIRAAAINNDGAGKVGFTAPSVDGQASVIAAAHALADIDARSIGYVECHGTATPLGDPIEFAGLVKAFRATTAERGFCSIGSVKGNVGHLDAAAGATGLIKAALAVRSGEIPPLVHFESPNPRIELDDSPFYVSTALAPWPAQQAPRRAGVSSLGVGGTNVHVVLEEAPGAGEEAAIQAGEPPYVLPLSARSPAALARIGAELAGHLADPAVLLADAARTLQVGRRRFAYRTAIVCSDRAEAIAKLGSLAPPADSAPDGRPPVIFMFPGQGAQYPGMGAGLYGSEPTFRDIVDRGAEILKPLLGRDIRSVLYGVTPPAEGAPHPIRSTVFAQPSLFLVEYATASLWMGWGVRPSAMIGHSVGEFVCAALAGVLSFEDALRLIAERGRLMQDMPAGAMLAVRLSEADLEPLLPDQVAIAAVNAPSMCVAAGPCEAISALEAELAGRGVMHRRLHTSHAFHSAMMEPVVAALAECASKLRLSPPVLPYVSGVTGDWITPDLVTSPAYWGRHCREPVRFADALTTVRGKDRPILLEVGPGRALASLAAQAVPRDGVQAIVTSLPDNARDTDDRTALAEAVAKLYVAGVEPDWTAFQPAGRRISLPTYPFERRRHWIAAPPPVQNARSGALAPEALPAPAQAGAAAHHPISPFQGPEPIAMNAPLAMTLDRAPKLRSTIVEILEALSGEQIAAGDAETSFLELGFDSLFLAQVATQVQKSFGLKITFRELLNDYPCVAALAVHLDTVLPPDPAPVIEAAGAPAGVAAPPATTVAAALPVVPPTFAAVPASETSATLGGLERVFRDQIQAMQQLLEQQCRIIQGAGATALAASIPTASVVAGVAQVQPASVQAVPIESAPALPAPASPKPAAADGQDNSPSRFDTYRAGASALNVGLSDAQRSLIDDLVARYSARTAGSKAMTEKHRPVLADPRAASGFRQEWKEIVYPIVCARSKGSKIWDVDGNEYVDVVNGYGQTAFGHTPDFVAEALAGQLEKGFAIGPQSPLACEVATLFTEMTGNERVTFCNTGSEAVMAAMRVARTVTGRDRVAVFGGAYHGQFDEVLVKGVSRNAAPRALPVAPGIPMSSIGNMVVLPYATPESLDWIRQNADDLAAVVVETVQSRHPNLRPVEFLKELRAVTERSGTALVFDEVVTGFRVHPGGMQAVFGIRADLATYGKVVGGGLPIGVLAGKARFMDALDGGQWRYGDGSSPEVAPTFFAGTFVRHPLAMAAAHAVLTHLKAAGPSLQEGLAARMAVLAGRINADLERRGIATRAETYSSWFYMNFAGEDRLAALLYPHMRLLGVHIQEGFPCFLTTAHSDADIELIFQAFIQSLDALQAAGVLCPKDVARELRVADAPRPAPAESFPAEVPMTEAQTEVWLAAQLGDEASCSFNESVSLRLDGPLDASALAAAVNDVVARHDALRASFGKGGTGMRVATPLPLDMPVVDLASAADRDQALKDLVEEEATQPFELADGPLVRARLLRFGGDHHVLLFTAHHIICDGWSMNIILGDLAACYAARCEGRTADLPTAMAFRRYALDQAGKNVGTTEAENFWLKQFETVPAAVELPSDRPRPVQKSFRGATYSGTIDQELYRSLKKAGARQGATLFMVLFSALQVLIARLSDQDDIVIAVPTAGQSLLKDEVLVGHGVNFLPIRAPVDRSASFSHHLQAVKARVLQAFEHQDYTFGTLVRKLGIRRDPSRLPLTDIQFNLERLGRGLEFPGLSVEFAPNPKAFTNFDLFLNFIESDNGLRIDCDYSTDLYDEATIARWIGHLRIICAAIVEDSAQPVATMPLLDSGERRWLAETLNDTSVREADWRPVHQLFEAQAARTPDAVAASHEDAALTYRELDARANRLARYLRGIVPEPGGRIGLATARSLDMLVALLAILKAGHAYVPLDSHYPAARLALVIEKAGLSALICDDAECASLAPDGIPVMRLEEHADDIAAASSEPLDLGPSSLDATAYVIFTSGSTGTPKGVEIAHRSLTNLLWSMVARLGVTERDTLLAVTTISFDIAGLELFMPLIAGARVVIAGRDEVRGGFDLVRRLETSHATIVQATPSLWRILTEAGLRAHPGLKMVCGGEALPRDLADALLQGGGELWNVYGPTETTIWSSAGKVSPQPGPIAIGEPLWNTQLHILDCNQQLAPIGVAGELHIGGYGLAQGYFGRPDLTAAAFRRVAVDGISQRLYRTGDIARRLADGSIQVLGRADDQVKLRGFRIELGDIEATLRKCPGVTASAAAIVAGEDGGQRLVGYYVEDAGHALTSSDLTQHAAVTLPDYMVPSAWMRLDALPLTPNGKLDRKALPRPDFSQSRASRIITPPQTPIEIHLTKIWSDVLRVDEIGVHDNLFSLGADSLHMFRIAARMLEEGIGLQAKHLLRHPTISELAVVSASSSADEATPRGPSLRSFRRSGRTALRTAG